MTRNEYAASIDVLQVSVTAPVVSFRDPMYAAVQVTLPCPPPATVGGMLAAAAGGWPNVNPETRFAMAFHARAEGVDLETYHPLDAAGAATDPVPRDREFLADITLTVWLATDPDLWHRRLRRPVWTLRLGRSQDLIGIRLQHVTLTRGTGQQRHGVLPANLTTAGTWLRLPTAISIDRSRTQWDDYRHHRTGTTATLTDTWVDPAGQAITFLPPTHPIHITAA